MLKQFLWEFLRYGVPSIAGITSGYYAKSRGWSTLSTAGAIAAGWGAGWFAQYGIGHLLEPKQLPLTPEILIPEGQPGDEAAPSADDVIGRVNKRAEGVKGLDEGRESSDASVTNLFGFDPGGSEGSA